MFIASVSLFAQARLFVSRSFGNFMATEGNARRLAEAESMEDEARYLVEEFKSKANLRAKQLNVRNDREEAGREGGGIRYQKVSHNMVLVPTQSWANRGVEADSGARGEGSC